MGNGTVVDFDYRGMVSSSCLSGEAKLLIYEDGLTLDGTFDRMPVAYADINSISLENYTVKIDTGSETITITQLGQACDWFFRDLTEAYNRKVLSSFRVTGEPVLEAEGRYVFSLSDDALTEEANSEQRMLKMRTPAVQELRRRFIGRVIHRSGEGWKRSLTEKLDAWSSN